MRSIKNLLRRGKFRGCFCRVRAALTGAGRSGGTGDPQIRGSRGGPRCRCSVRPWAGPGARRRRRRGRGRGHDRATPSTDLVPGTRRRRPERADPADPRPAAGKSRPGGPGLSCSGGGAVCRGPAGLWRARPFPGASPASGRSPARGRRDASGDLGRLQLGGWGHCCGWWGAAAAASYSCSSSASMGQIRAALQRMAAASTLGSVCRSSLAPLLCFASIPPSPPTP